MNTPAHLIFSAAFFAKPNGWRNNLAALLGGFLPDFSLYFMVFWNRFVVGLSPEQIFTTEYFSPYWQSIFAIDNSLFMWVVILLIGFWVKLIWLQIFAGSGLLHIILDFLLHHDDARSHFWPVSNWIFESPVSYWDAQYYGYVIGPVEGLICLAMLVVLWKRFNDWPAKLMIISGGIVELVPALLFPVMYG